MLSAGVSPLSLKVFKNKKPLALNETGYEMLVDLRSDFLSARYKHGKGRKAWLTYAPPIFYTRCWALFFLFSPN
jgi:hypothetical protein